MLHQLFLLLLLMAGHCSTVEAQSLRFLSPQPFTAYVPSGASPGRRAYQVYAAGTNGTVSYSILESDSANPSLFSINNATGLITNTAPYPSTPNQYRITVQASLSSSSISSNLTIIVLPSFDATPRFERTSYVTSITENGLSPFSLLTTQAFSLSTTNNIVYTIVSGNMGGVFSISSTTGIITVTTPLDREMHSQYLLTVRYIDDVGSIDTQVQVLVNDVNDNGPVFNNSYYYYTIEEGVAFGRPVGSVLATDPDNGLNGTISYSLSGPNSNKFSVSSDGLVSTAAVLNYEELVQFSFTVTASDNGDPPQSSTAALVIQLNNTDDECPSFSGSVYVKDVPYDFTSPPVIGDHILTIEAYDPDNIGGVSYSLISGNDEGVFQLDPVSGNISIARNEEAIRGQYVLIVAASDANCVNISRAQVEIGIGSANEHSPTFDESTCTASLTENPPNGTFVTQVVAMDDDFGANGRITYDILPNIGDFELFEVNPSTGVVTTTQESRDYDRESRSRFQVGITATDGGFRQDFCILTINLLDENDNEPIFDLSEYSTNIGDTPINGSYIIQVQAQDMDFGSNGEILYTLNNTSSGNCPFIIDQLTGTITVSSSVLTTSNCVLNITASDQGLVPRHSSVIVNITILHDGKVPVFSSSSYNVTIPEDYSSSKAVINVTASVSSNSFISYHLINGLEYHTNSLGNFRIFPSSGEIRIESNKPIDYERLYPGPYSFRLQVTASAANVFSSTTVTVHVTDVNDNFPTFPDTDGDPSTPPSITFNVVEGQPPGPVGIVKATDNDTGINGIIEYELRSANPSNSNFTVDQNGTVYSLATGLDAEAVSMSYMLTIGAFNPGVPNQEGIIHVFIAIEDINDNRPVFTQSVYNILLNETQLVPHLALELTANDPDRNDQGRLVYAILSGNTEATFQLRNNAGKGELYLRRSLDYERYTQYSLSVQVSDGIYTDTGTVSVLVVNVDDEPPIFSQSLYTASVVENSPVGTVVLTVNATDLDSNTIQYELKGLAEGRFSIDNNGVIRISGGVDREEFLPSEEIVFLVFAYGGSLSTADISIHVDDINDYYPQFLFAPFYGTAPENTPPGAEGLYITTVRAVDLDKGENGTLTYSLVTGEQDGFSIDPVTGVIIANRTFDRETTRFFQLVTMATDNGGAIQLSSTVEVIVEISDHNDNQPSWVYPYMYARVYENEALGHVVIQLPAIDPDNGVNASVFFILVSGNEENKFNLTASTGEVRVAGSLDYENLAERRYLLYFSIMDGGSPPLRSPNVGELEIHVLDDNDHSPSFDTHYSSIALPEDTPINAHLITLTATDTDQGTNSLLSYEISNGDSNHDFDLISHSNGSVTLILARALDFEATPNYTLSLTVRDHGYPPLTDRTVINITLTDVNDEQPLFSSSHFTGSIAENMNSLPVSLLYTGATDPDSDDIPGGLVDRYELLWSDDTNNNFNYNNGWLTVVQSLDRETKAQYHFIVQAIDNDPLSPLSSTATITVTVLDVNDHPSQNGGQLQVLIRAQDVRFPAQELGQVYFIDNDDNDTFTACSIVSGDSHLFSIHSSNCSLYSTVSDFPAGVSYGVEVRGHDGVHDFVTTTVSIIMHNVSVVPPVRSLISITLNVSGDQYLDQLRSSIVNVISDTVSVQSTSLNILTVQQGHHDPDDTVDLLFAVMNSNGVFMDPTLIINKLYLERSSIYSNLLYSLPVDACINEPCANLGQCTTVLSISPSHTSRLASKWYILFNPLTSVSYQCTCLLGTAGDHCEINYDDCYSNPCQYGGTCTDGIQDYTCTCPEGTAGKDCSINTDECTSNPCINGGTCTNGFNRHECICPVGYYGDRCEYAYFTPSSFCDSAPCLNNGTCSNGRDSFTCVCSSDFIGRFCEQSAQFQGGCSNNPCYNGSTCTETPNGYTCTCSIGFTGPNCRFPLNNCELEYCRNGGTCERGLYGAYNCLCPSGYGGQYCTELLSSCHSSPCLNGGTCIGNTSSYTCTCTRGYYGDTCQYPIVPTNLCTTLSPCHSSSVCSPGSGNYTCVCTDGSGGDDCSLTLPSPSPCDSNPCLHGGQCTNNGPQSFQCTCPVGYTGLNCQEDINECSPNPCSNNGSCYNGFGSYICTCSTGFTGRECQEQCPVGHDGENCEININYCRPDSCSNGGSCIETDDGYTCACPPLYTGTGCTATNDCNVNSCTNNGLCTNDTVSGFKCSCTDGEMRDDHCRLTTVSFNGDQATPSYRAYRSIGFGSSGDIQFDFSTASSDGVLLFNTQHQGGISADFISVEISGGILLIKYSLGGANNINNVSILSTSVSVADGHWHTLLINIRGNSLVATLDYCIQLMDTYSSLDCTASITADTNYSSLELGLPLWLGGVPVSAPVLPAGGISACIRGLLMDGGKIDLGAHVEERNSQNGCPQIYNSCDGITCNEGSCTPLWYDYICICPQRITGRNCTQEAQGLTFNGRSLLWYSLVVARGERTRRQTTPTQSLSNYRESVSLWFRTEEDNGVLFIIGRTTGEHLMIRLQGGRLHHSINLGSVTDTFTTASTHHDGRWHHINISRVGLISQINIDDTRINLTHSGPEITLEYSSNQIYFSGNLLSNQTVTDGYTGCIQDVRLDHTPLPVADSNQYASVTYIGDTPESGCRVGPCYPNPCNTGTCTETTHNSFMCICNGRSQTSPCDTPNSNNTLIGIAVAVAILIFISILIAVLVIGLVVISKYGKRKKKYLLSDTVLGRGGVGRSNEHIEIHPNLYAYDEEGGEQDTSVNNGNHDDTMDHSPIVNEGRYSPSMSTLERNRDYDVPRTRKQFTPSSLKRMRENNPPPPVPPHSETPPTGTTPPVRGTPSLKGRSDSAHSTPPVHHLLHPVQETPPVTIMPSPHLPVREEGTKERPIAVGTPPLPSATTTTTTTTVSDRVTSELRTKGTLPLIVNQPERASTPDIDRFIEDKVNNANSSVQDIDSLREYSDEGIEINDGGSLSDISQVSFELYTFQQLREAGDPFTNVADILEPVYDEESEEEDSDTSTEGGGD